MSYDEIADQGSDSDSFRPRRPGEPWPIDWVAVERAADGNRLPLNRTEKWAAVHFMRQRGCTWYAISRTLRMSGTYVARNLAITEPPCHGNARRVAA